MSAFAMAGGYSSPPNLLTVIIDAATFTWAHRSLARTAKDKALAAQGKPSAGPATLDDVVTSVLLLGASLACTNRDNALVVIAATEGEVGVIYPRKGGDGSMEEVVVGYGGGGDGRGGGGECGERMDLGLLNDYVRLGVAEMVNRAAERAEERAAGSSSEGRGPGDIGVGGRRGAAIASALSVAMCTINRFMVASNARGGVSALSNTSSLRRADDEGILALMGGDVDASASGGGSQPLSTERSDASTTLSPRVLIIQASPDRTSDYNALMNCAFAANKADIVIDGCFVPSGTKDDRATSSPYLQQLVDRTGGVYLSVPSGAAQVGGALSEVLLSVFLPPPSIRGGMNLPRQHNVDFRARCFETGESVDVAQICNQCLSIFKERPRESCPTCGAMVRRKASDSGNVGAKKMKL
ncbi:hypothetical protein ACHAXA_008734 [Cyclostephanos tholiformis]|jgi:transcription initiation factor TFIIH subunit 3|uniref:RNA polymerase II transcription factor B subunit 4 n=1 Tax=Cyclostephanos tholiformis TaxID=382380 RepID=A0ABD3RBD6_9STRA